MTGHGMGTVGPSKPPGILIHPVRNPASESSRIAGAAHANGPPTFEFGFEPAAKRVRLEAPSDDAAAALRSSNKPASSPRTDSKKHRRKVPVRPRVRFATGIEDKVDGASTGAREPQSHSALPFPLEPDAISAKWRASREQDGISVRAICSEKVQVKPFVLEPPSDAPRYPKNRPADFFPWTGNNPEDRLSGLAMQRGLCDKSLFSQIGLTTARPHLWPSIKHKSGLQVLSSMFVAALDRRRARGIVPRSCTFRPPPRVTLTDTKRETWLRDLANPTIPLRRLSRTIPHGVRNKLLLDQCLTKRIPIERVVWFAKCVGANEIRAFKRKGASGAFAVGGETKWIKDWTANVEQFLELLIQSPGTPDWKSNLDYGLRLAVYLYSEQLLDQEHYFGWLADALHQCSSDNLPTWLLLVKLHFQDIVQFRQSGRRLAESLLKQLSNIYSVNHDLGRTVSRPPSLTRPSALQSSLAPALDLLIDRLMMSSSSSLILPGCWSKCEGLIRSSSNVLHSAMPAMSEAIHERNMRVRVYHDGCQLPLQLSHRARCINLLDALLDHASLEEVARQSIKALESGHVLINLCLRWCSTTYRAGSARIYAAVRLLRKWSRMGIDLERPILEFLASNEIHAELCSLNIYRVLAELTRSRHFSVGRYLQWLIAAGALNRSKTNQDANFYAGVLFELPLHQLPAHTTNLRRILLESVDMSIRSESVAIGSAKVYISQKLLGLIPAVEPLTDQDLTDFQLAQHSGTVKLEAAHWLRQQILAHVTPDVVQHFRDVDGAPNHRIVPGISSSLDVSRVKTICELFEDLGDYTMLADVLVAVSRSRDIAVLGTVAVMVTHYFDIFHAIGAAADLFHRLFHQCIVIRRQKPVQKLPIETLIDLGNRFSNQKRRVQALRSDLRQQEKDLETPNSPMSDHVRGNLRFSEGSLFAFEEIEQALSSSKTLDEETSSQFFSVICQHLESAWTESLHSQFACGTLLSRLRWLEPQGFQRSMDTWLGKLMLSSARPNLKLILMPLICAQTISLRMALNQLRSLLDTSHTPLAASKLATELVDLLIEEPQRAQDSFDHPYYYRFRVEQQKMVRTSAPFIAIALPFILGDCRSAAQSHCSDAQPLLHSGRFKSLMCKVLISNHEGSDHLRQCLQTTLPVEDADRIVQELVHLGTEQQSQTTDVESRITMLLGRVSYFNEPLCRAGLQFIFRSATESLHDAADTLILWLLGRTSLDMLECTETWSSLVLGLPSEHSGLICDKIETRILALIDDASSSNEHSIRRLLSVLVPVVSAKKSALSKAESASRATHIADRLTRIWFSFSSTTSTRLEDAAKYNTTDTRQDRSAVLVKIEALVQLLAVHQSALNTSSVAYSKLSRLLFVMRCLLVHPSLKKHRSLQEQVFDVLTVIADSLSPEHVQILRQRSSFSGTGLKYLIGSSRSSSHKWLRLAPKKSSSVAASTLPQYPVRKWEMMQDPTPLMGENDTGISLALFGARKAVL